MHSWHHGVDTGVTNGYSLPIFQRSAEMTKGSADRVMSLTDVKTSLNNTATFMHRSSPSWGSFYPLIHFGPVLRTPAVSSSTSNT